MKHKLLAYSFAPALALGLLGPVIASAHGMFGGFDAMNTTPDQVATRMQTVFQNEATMLGVSVDDVKNGWAQGKGIAQIAQDHGITQDQLAQKIKDARAADLKSQMQALVTKGIITQQQADQRMQALQNQNVQNNKKGGMRGVMRGRGMGRWF